MAQSVTDHVAILRFLATSRWYLLVARLHTDEAGRVRIEPPAPPDWAARAAANASYTHH